MQDLRYATKIKSALRLLDAHYIFDSPYAERRFGEEIFRCLDRTPPTFIVDRADNTTEENLNAGGSAYRRFREFIQDNYVWIHTAGTLIVYRHKTRYGA